jgi:hypothetical protein
MGNTAGEVLQTPIIPGVITEDPGGSVDVEIDLNETRARDVRMVRAKERIVDG